MKRSDPEAPRIETGAAETRTLQQPEFPPEFRLFGVMKKKWQLPFWERKAGSFKDNIREIREKKNRKNPPEFR